MAGFLIGAVKGIIAASFSAQGLYVLWGGQAQLEFAERFPTGTDDENDAFRHAYVAARLQQLIGSEPARALGDLNELLVWSNNDDAKNMDYYNNSQGIIIGENNPTTNPAIADETIADAVALGINNGTILTDPPTNYNYTPYVPSKDELDEILIDLNNDLSSFFDGMWGTVEGAINVVAALPQWLSDAIAQVTTARTEASPLVFDLDGW